MADQEPVGLVAGTEDSTPLLFSVGLAPGQYLQLDDVVVTRRPVPGVGDVTTSGVVTEIRARHEGATYASDVFLIADGVLPAQVQEIAEITTTRVEPECYVPPTPGSPARRATGDERSKALYFDQMESTVAVGLGRDGEPILLNLEFLDGTRGGHVSISGISGVATKTSFALFLVYSIFHSGALGRRSVNAKALVFSVKGEDLLFLDRANTRLDDKQRERYRALGLPAEPFASAGFFAPPMPDDPAGRPHVTGRTSGVTPFWWTLAEFCRGELLPYAFADAEDERNQYTMVIHQVAAQLRREAVELDQGAVVLGGRTIRTYAQLVEFVSDKLNDEDERRDWAGPVTGTGTINAFLRRLRSSLKPLRTLLRGDLAEVAGRKVSTEGQQVTVVDLHNLPERAQRFVVGVVLAAETARKETAGTGGLLFTMIDELNKYAPREGSSPIKEVLLDIAERGRSRGIILIGAQQTASEVERRIVSNSSVKVVGRLDPAEAGRPEYGFLPPSQRARAVLAKPGAMFVSQPEIPVPLAVEFPFPAWATRLSEAGEEPVTAGYATGNGAVRRDPFAHLPAATEDDDAPVLLGGAQGRTRGPERDVRGAGGALQLGDPGQLGGGVRVGRFAVERGPQLGRATLRRGEGTGGLLLGAGGGRLLPAARGRGPVGLGERAVGRVTVAFRGFCGGAGRAGPGFPAGGLVPRPPGRRSTRGHCSRRGPTPDPACGGRSCSTSSWRACDGRLAAGRAQPG